MIQQKRSAPTKLNVKATVKDLVLPFKILISPFKTFTQLAQNPNVKGLISLSALIIIVIAATLYASAARIDLMINNQSTSFLATDAFNSWFASNLAASLISVLLYWLVLATGLAMLSRMFAGKQVSLRVVFPDLAYLLSVFVILYAVRAAMYLALPTIPFGINYWPPAGDTDVNAAVNLMTETWSPLYVYQFGYFFNMVAYVWLIVLSAIAVKTLREISWSKSLLISAACFFITLFLQIGPL